MRRIKITVRGRPCSCKITLLFTWKNGGRRKRGKHKRSGGGYLKGGQKAQKEGGSYCGGKGAYPNLEKPWETERS